MMSFESQRNNEALTDITSLTKPDDVLDMILNQEIADNLLPHKEKVLGFLPQMFDDGGKGDKTIKKEINKMSDQDPIKSLAESYMNIGIRASVALEQARATNTLNLLDPSWTDTINKIKQNTYLPTAILEQVHNEELKLQEEYNTDNIIMANQLAKGIVDALLEDAKYKELKNNKQFDSMSALEQKREIEALNILEDNIIQTNRRTDAGDGMRTIFAPNDHSCNIKVNYDKHRPSDLLAEFETKKRIYSLGEEYESNGALRSIVYNVVNGQPLTGNEIDLSKREEKKIYEMIQYGKRYDNSLIATPESFDNSRKDIGAELNTLDTIYTLDGDNKKQVVKLLEKGYSPIGSLEETKDDNLLANLDKKIIKKQMKEGEERESILSHIKESLIL